MNSILFMKRIFTNRIYWLSVMAAILLLLCSVVYIESSTGTKYTFTSLFYDGTVKEALETGSISMKNIIIGYDTSYLWMFCPIIVGIPCVIVNKTERFVLFRTSKNKYLFSKYFSTLFSSGLIILLAYIVYGSLSMLVTKENMWDEFFIKKLLSVFCLGVISSLPSIVLSEFVHNKYLILCIPFVFNYFMYIFLGNIIPYEVGKYIYPSTYQILFLYEKEMVIPCVAILIVMVGVCGLLKKYMMERRCDCGQQ